MVLEPRRDSWVLRTRTLRFGPLPMVMGIVNVTPDSFSDGGQFFDAPAAVAHGVQLVAEGAEILDVGGESTRPYSQSVAIGEELRRVLPVVAALAEQVGVPISIDTSKAEVARRAIDAGAEIINDVTALAGDPDMLEVAARTGAGVCAMHMRGTPQTMQDDPAYADVVGEVLGYLRARRDVLTAAGIPADRIALDPGIGFGKRTEHNLALLKDVRRLHALGCPLLVGHSRKGFIQRVLEGQHVTPTADSPAAGTVGVAAALARQGVQVLRVHDVALVRHALVLFAAAGGL